MQVINKWQLKQLREEYPVGTRVELIHMDDPFNRKLVPGCQGTVRWVDDMGTIHVSWDCGSGLGLIPGEDEFKKIASHPLSLEPGVRLFCICSSFQFLHQLDAVMETVDEGLVFVGHADPAAEVEYCIVVIQGQDFQEIL